MAKIGVKRILGIHYLVYVCKAKIQNKILVKVIIITYWLTVVLVIWIKYKMVKRNFCLCSDWFN